MTAIARLPILELAYVVHCVERAYRSATHDGSPGPAWDELDQDGREKADARVRRIMAGLYEAKNPADHIAVAVVESLLSKAP